MRSKVLGDVATDITREDRTIDIRSACAGGVPRQRTADLREPQHRADGHDGHPAFVGGERWRRRKGPPRSADRTASALRVITANLVDRDLASASADIETELARTMTLRPMGASIGAWEASSRRWKRRSRACASRSSSPIFMVYLVMASQFESLLHPFVILFSVPFSLVGVLVTLYLLNVTVSVVVLIGVIMLAGIVVNNAIILVDTTNRLRREGRAKVEALKEAGKLRFRPILMTTSTTVLGLLPMALGLGEGSELRAPMAITVIGGLLVSTVLTLLIIPAVYAVVDRTA